MWETREEILIYRGKRNLTTEQRKYLAYCEKLADDHIAFEEEIKLARKMQNAGRIKTAAARLDEMEDKLKQHFIAHKILFQKKIRQQHLEARESALSDTLLGGLKAALNDFRQVRDCEGGQAPLSFEQALKILEEALNPVSFAALHTVISQCLAEAKHIELPPAPTDPVLGDTDLPQEWLT